LGKIYELRRAYDINGSWIGIVGGRNEIDAERFFLGANFII
jgi:hypothetical protein